MAIHEQRGQRINKMLKIKALTSQKQNMFPYIIKLEQTKQGAVLLHPDGKITHKQYDQYGGAGSHNLGIIARIQYRNKIKEVVVNAKAS